MKLIFTKEERLSINYLVQCLIKADGLILLEENVCWNTVSLKMGWPDSESISAAYEMHTAISVLTEMELDKKRFATAFFIMIILADQQIAPEEAELMKRLTTEGNLPSIEISDCAKVLEQYFN